MIRLDKGREERRCIGSVVSVNSLRGMLGKELLSRGAYRCGSRKFGITNADKVYHLTVKKQI